MQDARDKTKTGFPPESLSQHDGALDVMSAVDVYGRAQITLAVSGVGAESSVLDAGIYDVWCDEATVFIKVAPSASDVTTSSGYVIKPGNVVSVVVPSGGNKVGGITSGVSATLRLHRVR
jgi:hypothetical protein